MKNVAVILSGNGVYDGSEIHEAVLTLLAIENNQAGYRCFAPNIKQYHVINHLTGEVSENESRNVLVESARIARGDIEDLSELLVDEFDALIVPGGFGVAKNLCTFAFESEKSQINEVVLKACQGFVKENKPAGFMCIAPALIPAIYGKGAMATIGKELGTAESLTDMGLSHVACEVDDIVIDQQRKLVSTPAYMQALSISDAALGINKLVKAVLRMV